MTEQSNKKRTYIQMLLLAIILVGFPFGSYVYLKKGYNYQKAAREQLRQTDKMPSHQALELLKGELPETMEEKMFVLAMVGQKASFDAKQFAEVLSNLHNQFDEPKNIQFWTVFENQNAAFVEQFTTQNNIKEDEEQLLYFNASTAAFQQFNDALNYSEKEMAFKHSSPTFALVDDSLYVRRIFDANDAQQVRQLVEVTALLLPERKKEQARVVRETEK